MSGNLSEADAPPPVEHHQSHRRGSERESPPSRNDQQRDQQPLELALTESTITPPVTRDRPPWTEGNVYDGRGDEAERQQGGDESKGSPSEVEMVGGEERGGGGGGGIGGDEENQHRAEAEKEDDEKEEKEKKSASPVLSKHATHLYTVSYLVFFSFWGTLARLGLQSLTFYTGAPVVTGVLWANVAGCIVMGFFLEDRNIFKEEWGDGLSHLPEKAGDKSEKQERIKKHNSTKKTIPLYIGLTTGFCGCLTSFSSFIRDIFLALSNDLPNPSTSGSPHHRNGGYSFMAVVAMIIIEVALSLSALIFGAHVALGSRCLTPTIPFKFTRRFMDRVVVVLGWGCWLGSIFLAIWPPDRHSPNGEKWRGRAIFAVVFSPLGCLFRFYISLFLNARIPTFPLGTFTANVFGTMILGMCYDLQHVRGIGGGSAASSSKSLLTSCQVLQGIMDGFCGTLTTVSTWVAELNGLSRRQWAYFYGIASIGISLGFLVIIMGSLRWTLGFASPVCG